MQLCMESGINEEKKNESMDFQDQINTFQFRTRRREPGFSSLDYEKQASTS